MVRATLGLPRDTRLVLESDRLCRTSLVIEPGLAAEPMLSTNPDVGRTMARHDQVHLDSEHIRLCQNGLSPRS